MSADKSSSRFTIETNKGGIALNRDHVTSAAVVDDGVVVFLCNHPYEILVKSDIFSRLEILNKITDAMQVAGLSAGTFHNKYSAYNTHPWNRIYFNKQLNNMFSYIPLGEKGRCKPLNELWRAFAYLLNNYPFHQGMQDYHQSHGDAEDKIISNMNLHGECECRRMQLVAQNEKRGTLSLGAEDSTCFTPEGQLNAAAKVIDFLRQSCKQTTAKEIASWEINKILETAIGTLGR